MILTSKRCAKHPFDGVRQKSVPKDSYEKSFKKLKTALKF